MLNQQTMYRTLCILTMQCIYVTIAITFTHPKHPPTHPHQSFWRWKPTCMASRIWLRLEMIILTNQRRPAWPQECSRIPSWCEPCPLSPSQAEARSRQSLARWTFPCRWSGWSKWSALMIILKTITLIQGLGSEWPNLSMDIQGHWVCSSIYETYEETS